MKELDLCKLLLTGVHAGDSLGSTVEFENPESVKQAIAYHSKDGWPFRQVGGGPFGWKPGEATDDSDLAWAILHTVLSDGEWNPQSIANAFAEWRETGPRDIGGTTASALGHVARGVPWNKSALHLWARNIRGWSNGGLMRNGIVPALAGDDDELFTFTFEHTLVTHYAPLVHVCGAIHSWMIFELLNGRWPFERKDWMVGFFGIWWEWLDHTDNPYVHEWKDTVGSELDKQVEELAHAKFHPDEFNPYEAVKHQQQGYVLLSLQIAVWTLLMAAMPPDEDVSKHLPDWFPENVRNAVGPWRLAWGVLTGADSDTYGAIAGPLVAAHHGSLPAGLTEGLQLVQAFDDWVAENAAAD